MNSGYPLGAGGPPPAQFGGPFGGPPPGAFGPPPGAGLMPPGTGLPGADPSAQDPAQLQQLVQLLGAKVLPKQTAVVECPKSMVGRVIGKGGETIKALQQYTGAMIQVRWWWRHGLRAVGQRVQRPESSRRQRCPLPHCSCLPWRPASPMQIDQSTDPTRVTIAGSPQSLQLAVSMVNDIVRGTFKGFAMLRQIAISTSQQAALGQYGQPQPVYVQVRQRRQG